MIDMAVFRRCLADTIAWCARQAAVSNPSDCLRSPELRPEALDETKGWERYDWPTHRARVAVTTALTKRRSASLRAARHGRALPVEGMADGRLLLYHPDANLYDGAAERESYGYFDVDNVPPWDTWIAYVHDAAWQMGPTERDHTGFTNALYDNRSYAGLLIAWVPAPLLALAERGIAVNPERCITWADAIDTAFTRRLYHAGLLAIQVP